MYTFFFFMVCFVMGLVGVASCPAPLFGVGALVFGAVLGCGLLVWLGASFVGLVLLLVYLGGMLVVFAYSVAMAAESYPEGWGEGSVLMYGLGYVGLILFVGLWALDMTIESGEEGGLLNIRRDFCGVVLLFSNGGGLLFLSVWGLLLTLFVVLELVRGRGSGSLRMP